MRSRMLSRPLLFPRLARGGRSFCIRQTRYFAILFVAVLGLISASDRLSAQDEAETFFETQVRPLLVARCLGCHGPTETEGGLQVDRREALIRGGDRGPAIEPGNPQAGTLLAAIRGDDDLQMPPDRPLDAEQIQTLERWVAEGAFWPEPRQGRDVGLVAGHWAFRSVEVPEVPTGLDPIARQPLDRFIHTKLEQRGFAPLDAAERDTLLRRVTFDLVGLPPDSETVAEFEQDSRPDAWERQIDRLLASARFGEHWTRHWLDVARYADNKGYVFFEDKEFPWSWAYRDWVVRALDEDLPYDRFIELQLAADQAAPDDPTSLAALGFLTIGGHFINNTHDIVDDRIDVVTRGLTGLTVACARCHDHKYDPITIEDYYALYGVFASSYEPMVPPALPRDPLTQSFTAEAIAGYEAELQRRAQDLETFVGEKVASLELGARRRVDEYLMAEFERRRHPTAEDFMLIADPDDINPAMITRYESYLREKVDTEHSVWGAWKLLSEWPPDRWSDPAALPEAIADHTWDPLIEARLLANPPDSVQTLATRYGEWFREVDDALSKPEAAETAAIAAGDPLEALRREMLADGVPAKLPVQLDWGFLSLFPDRATQDTYKQKLGALEAWLKDPPEAPPRAMALLDRPQPSNTPVFLRGNPNRPGELVKRGVPQAFVSAPVEISAGSGRLELARHLIDPQHPTTDRVQVNRIWMHLFGSPLVATPGDFGLRSDPPRHQDLLDHLVIQWRDSQRSHKALLREIVTSAAYRRTSRYETTAIGQAQQGIDPEADELWRQRRKRLSFEAMRDNLLAVADRLTTRRFGKSEPALASFGRRRSLYAYIDRLDVAPLATTFDVPDPAATAPARSRTVVPPQALFWLNHPELEALAREIVQHSEGLETETGFERLCRQIWQRSATSEEQQWAREFLETEQGVGGEEGMIDAKVRLVHALLMANETIFID